MVGATRVNKRMAVQPTLPLSLELETTSLSMALPATLHNTNRIAAITFLVSLSSACFQSPPQHYHRLPSLSYGSSSLKHSRPLLVLRPSVDCCARPSKDVTTLLRRDSHLPPSFAINICISSASCVGTSLRRYHERS